MNKYENDETVIPFDDIIKEMYDNKHDRYYLLCIEKYILRNKKKYCLVHLYTLISSIRGYLDICKIAIR